MPRSSLRSHVTGWTLIARQTWTLRTMSTLRERRSRIKESPSAPIAWQRGSVHHFDSRNREASVPHHCDDPGGMRNKLRHSI